MTHVAVPCKAIGPGCLQACPSCAVLRVCFIFLWFLTSLRVYPAGTEALYYATDMH